jgi:hypothetical protein
LAEILAEALPASLVQFVFPQSASVTL